MPTRIAVLGGGVAGLSTVYHLLELWEARATSEPLEITWIAHLLPQAGRGGNGIAGKAMSRAFEGYFDTFHNLDRRPFFGPMMPYKGVVPHGYHVLWDYRNLRRLLGDPGDGMGILRPPPHDGKPGGSGMIASFQGRLDDPAPGGPGIASMGLVDPEHPATATRAATRALFRLRDQPASGLFIRLFERLFGTISRGVDPLVFADLLYAHEIDIELRLTLIAASLNCRLTNPEKTTMPVGEQDVPLYGVDYETWMRHLLGGWAGGLQGDAKLLRWLQRELKAVSGLIESRIEASNWLDRALRAVLPDDIEDDLLTVYFETERVLRAVPGGLARLATGSYPVWNTFHIRFGPDATFSSPHPFDAAQAMRSLAFCFVTPRAGRAWSADGGRIQDLWVRFFERLDAKARALGPQVTLIKHEGRVATITEGSAGVEIQWGTTHGHGGTSSDLHYPHVPSVSPPRVPPLGLQTVTADVCVPTFSAPLLAATLPEPLRPQLDSFRFTGNTSLELMLYLKEPIQYAQAARDALTQSCITSLEGPFCLLADYSCGLWSQAVLEQERPFGPEVPFHGAIIESCGGFEEVYACLDRYDAYGWPPEVKATMVQLLSDPSYFDEVDPRPWAYDESGWERRRADGTWSEARINSASAAEDWFIACRYLAWGYLRQLSHIQALGEVAVRQFARYAELLDPRGLSRQQILQPPAELLAEVRYVVMRNSSLRNRIYCPSLGQWPARPISGLPLPGTRAIFPAGDWTRNGLDIVCMEAACLSGMRAARAAYGQLTGEPLPADAPGLIQVLPDTMWYSGNDPDERA